MAALEVPMLPLLVSAAFAATPDELVAAVEAHLSHEAHEGPGACLTPLVNELKLRAEELTPAQRKRVTAALMPWKADLNDPVVPLRTTPPPPDAAPTEPCFSLGENRLTSEHFAVEWDGNTIDEDTAQDFLDALEDGYRVEVGELGWEEPLQGDRYLLLAYVEDSNYQGAYTTVESCGGSMSPYIVASAGSFSSRSWADTMAVHEFNHALQFGYGYAWEFWWWEATATYIESQVYPNSNWWAYYVSGYSDNPYLAFNASDQRDQDIFWHMYGMAIWGAYLDEYMGGHETVLATWQAAERERGYYTFGMDDAFESMDLDFDAAYTDFIAKNAVMQYEAQRVLPEVDERDSFDELPASDEADGNTRPQGYGQTYTRFEAGAGEGDLRVTFSGDVVPWSVQLVEIEDEAITRVAVGTIENGEGEVVLEDFGANDVVLVISPLTDDEGKYSYEWEADIAEPVAAAPPPEETPTACGCTTGGDTAGIGIGGLFAVAALARRRRSSTPG